MAASPICSAVLNGMNEDEHVFSQRKRFKEQHDLLASQLKAL
jgi:hypothetical protein